MLKPANVKSTECYSITLFHLPQAKLKLNFPPRDGEYFWYSLNGNQRRHPRARNSAESGPRYTENIFGLPTLSLDNDHA